MIPVISEFTTDGVNQIKSLFESITHGGKIARTDLQHLIETMTKETISSIITNSKEIAGAGDMRGSNRRDTYLLDRKSYTSIDDNSLDKEISFAERSIIQFEKFMRILELINAGLKDKQISKLLKNMEKFSLDLSGMSGFVNKRHQMIRLMEKEFVDFKMEAEEKLRQTELDLEREITKYERIKGQLYEVKEQLKLNKDRKNDSKESSGGDFGKDKDGEILESRLVESDEFDMEEIKEEIRKTNEELMKPKIKITPASHIPRSLTESQHWAEMKDLNKINKGLLEDYSDTENELLRTKAENRNLRNKLLELSTKVNKYIDSNSDITKSQLATSELKKSLRESVNFGVELPAVPIKDPTAKDYMNRVEELAEELDIQKRQKEALMREIEELKMENRKLELSGGRDMSKVAGDDTEDEDMRRSEGVSSKNQALLDRRDSELTQVCVEMSEGDVERVTLIRTSETGKELSEEISDKEKIKLKMRNSNHLLKASRIQNQNVSINSPNPSDSTNKVLIKPKMSIPTSAKEEIQAFKELIEKQNLDLNSFKSKIRDLKYEVIEAKDRELKWYGKYMEIQRSANSSKSKNSLQKSSMLQMSKFKINGDIDLEASLMTIIEANEHLEEESKKILEENKKLRRRFQESRLELMDTQRKKERLEVQNMTMEREMNFLKKR